MPLIFWFFKVTSYTKQVAIINHPPVVNIICAWIMDLDNDEDMLKLGSNSFGCEWQSTRLLKDYGYDIIPDVSLA